MNTNRQIRTDHFNHHTAIQIRFVDIDKLGHVNNAVHLSYYETARVHYFHALFGKDINWEKTGMILAKSEIEYLIPVQLEDELTAYTRISRMGNKSFEIENVLVRKTIGGEKMEICSLGKSIIVCFDYQIKESIAIPEEWRKKISVFENL